MRYHSPVRPLTRLRNAFVPAGLAPRRILTGAFSGLTLILDLRCQAQCWLGLYERELYRPLRRLSCGIRTAVDLGCAEGEFTVYFLARTPATTVFAIDGNADYLEALRRNVQLNPPADSRLVLHQGYIESLDWLVDQIEPPCLLKMDIDGGESSVLANSPRLLALPRMRWVIEVHSADLERDCVRLLEQNRYRARIVNNAWWRHLLHEQRPIELNRWIVAER